MEPISRRSFLKSTGAAAAVSTIGAQRLFAASIGVPLGLQLYSVRALLPKDFEGTLHQLSAAGYKEVEAAGYYNKTAREWRHAMDQAGLHCVSTHHPLGQLKEHEDEFIAYGNQIGLKYMICSSPMHRDPNAKGPMTLDDWHWVCDEFNRIGEKIKKAGMQFGYHNHVGEFQSEHGEVFYDVLIKNTDPKLLVLEMDCGWVTAAGRDPVEYLSKMPERFPLLHVKDMVKGPDDKWHSVVMGKGVAHYKPILRAATGLKHYFVEQEEFIGDPMQELREDADYMEHFNV